MLLVIYIVSAEDCTSSSQKLEIFNGFSPRSFLNFTMFYPWCSPLTFSQNMHLTFTIQSLPFNSPWVEELLVDALDFHHGNWTLAVSNRLQMVAAWAKGNKIESDSSRIKDFFIAILQSDLEEMLAHSWVNAISVATAHVAIYFSCCLVWVNICIYTSWYCQHWFTNMSFKEKNSLEEKEIFFSAKQTWKSEWLPSISNWSFTGDVELVFNITFCCLIQKCYK